MSVLLAAILIINFEKKVILFIYTYNLIDSTETFPIELFKGFLNMRINIYKISIYYQSNQCVRLYIKKLFF